jgi:hypothetical protein
MDLATTARAAGAARAGIGAALLAAPATVGGPWLGEIAERPGARYAIAGLGARDLALGLGTFWAAGGRRRGVRTWLIASAAADAADLAGVVRFRGALSTASAVGTAALAGGSAVLHAWLLSELG